MYQNLKAYALPVIFGIVACALMIFRGYPLGHDWIFELVRIVEYHEALVSGQGAPIWGGHLYQGFGSPIFLFYAPLYVACTSLLVTVGLPVTAAAVTVLVLFALVSAVGVFGLVREVLGRETHDADAAARVAAAAYVFAPYFLANMLIRNASAEFLAMSLAPYPFWGLALLHRGKSAGLPLLAVSFALVVLAHNLSGLVVAAGLLIAVLVMGLRNFQLSVLSRAVVGLLLGLGLSCWFWLPALGLKSHVRIEEMLQGKFDFHNNFIAIGDLFGFGGLFAVGWVIPVFITLGIAGLILGKRSLLTLGLISAGLLFVFLQTDLSSWFWEAIPLLPLFQFPWRMLGPLSLVAAVMGGLLFHNYLLRWRHTEWLVIVLIAANALPLLQRYEPLSTEIRQFVTTSLNPQAIMLQGLQATVLDEYLPRDAVKEVSERVPPGAVVLPRSNSVPATVLRASRSNVYIEAGQSTPGELHLARWYFPGWRATIDGVDQLMGTGPLGTVMVNIPAGRHQVHVWISQPDLRKWGLLISGLSLLLVLGTALIGRFLPPGSSDASQGGGSS